MGQFSVEKLVAPGSVLSGNHPFRRRGIGGVAREQDFAACPSSDDLRHIAGLQKGGSGSSVIEIMRDAVDAASDGLRLSGA